MSVLDGLEVEKVYKHFKKKGAYKYEEEEHCKLLIKIMLDKNYGCYTAFCAKAMISEQTFHTWIKTIPLFSEIYSYTKMVSKQLWYEEGNSLKDREFPMGTVNYSFEHWKMLGWAKFGISKNSRIKINVDPQGTAAQHYMDIIKQAAEGDFTAAEFKQLMEAVNVGLNVHQVFELQKQIDELKSDVSIVKENSNNVDNPIADKAVAETN